MNDKNTFGTRNRKKLRYCCALNGRFNPLWPVPCMGMRVMGSEYLYVDAKLERGIGSELVTASVTVIYQSPCVGM